jgi:hypothetical protein
VFLKCFKHKTKQNSQELKQKYLERVVVLAEPRKKRQNTRAQKLGAVAMQIVRKYFCFQRSAAKQSLGLSNSLENNGENSGFVFVCFDTSLTHEVTQCLSSRSKCTPFSCR